MTSPRSRSLALGVAATAAALVLSACGKEDDPGQADDPVDEPSTGQDSSPATPSSEPTTAEPSPSETSDSGAPASTTTVPVYFVGDAPSGPRLYREFHQVEADNPLAEAVALLVAGDALDPDYRTLFPGGTVDDVTFDEAAGRINVVVPDDSWAAPAAGMSKAEARLAVQSLVYTVQGGAQTRAPVTVSTGDQPTSLFGIDTSNGVTSAPGLDVLNLVSVTTPEEGATVSGSFTASGIGSSFEATIPWEVRQGKKVVKQGFATAEGWMDKLYPWESQVDVSGLPPGTYTFAAMTDDPSDGEGFGPSEDTKTIIVE